jgi:hypothetical protein
MMVVFPREPIVKLAAICREMRVFGASVLALASMELRVKTR